MTLGLTIYLIGLALGSAILAPLSEMYGRKPVSVLSLLFFTVLIIPCGIGNSTTELIVVRLFGAVAGSAMISSAPGSVADMVDDEHRALAFSVWGIGPLNGPGTIQSNRVARNDQANAMQCSGLSLEAMLHNPLGGDGRTGL